MTGLLICATVVALVGWLSAVWVGEFAYYHNNHTVARFFAALGLALIAVALWLAYAAGGA